MSSPRRAGALFIAALAGAMLLGTALRVPDLGRECLWFDELRLLESTNQSFVAFARERWAHADPPLNELMAWSWNAGLRRFGLAGDEAWIRIPVLVFGVAAIGVAGLAAAAAYGRPAGMLAALLVATNPYHVRYSREARMYALTFLLSSAMVLFLVRTLRAGRRRDALACGLCGAAAAYAHYFALLPLAASFATTAVMAWRHRATQLWTLLRGQTAGLVVAAPYVVAQALLAYATNRGTRPWLKVNGPPGVAALAGTARAYASDAFDAVLSATHPGSLDAHLVTASITALAALVVLGIAARRRDEPDFLRAHLVAIVALPFAFVLAVSQIRPVFHHRYMMAVLPAAVLLLVRARPRIAVTLALLPIAVGALMLPRHRALVSKPDYRAAAVALVAEYRRGDAIDVRLHDQQMLRYYVARVAGEDAPLVTALLAVPQEWNAPGNLTLTADSAPPHPPPGRRLYEIDVLFPAATVAAEKVRARVTDGETLGRERHLVFEDGPLPWLRVWRSGVFTPRGGD